MSRVLVTGGAGTIGGAIVKRLFADPSYEVRVSDRQAAPQWMREGAEVHRGDLRVTREARAAIDGCTHVIHLAELDVDGGGVAAAASRLPYTSMQARNAICSAVIGAAVAQGVERFVYVSSAMVFERATEFPTSEAYLPDCPTPASAYGFAMLAGEMCCRAACAEHGLQYTICRPFDAYGPEVAPEGENGVIDLIARALSGETPPRIAGSGEQTRTPTHVDDVAGGVIAAMDSPAGVDEDFNIAAARELSVGEIARIVWETCGEDPAAFVWEPMPMDTTHVERRWPAVAKARRLLGWEARIEVEEGIAATVAWIRARGSVGSAT